jgi:hypothetical protein
MQTSINLALGSALANNALTIPTDARILAAYDFRSSSGTLPHGHGAARADSADHASPRRERPSRHRAAGRGCNMVVFAAFLFLAFVP